MDALESTYDEGSVRSDESVGSVATTYVPSLAESTVSRAASAQVATRDLEVLMAGLNSLAHGVAVFDAQGGLRYANSEAHIMLARVGWYATPSEPPRSAHPHLRWIEALHRVCKQELRELFEFPSSDAIEYAALVPVIIQGERFAFVTFGRGELCGSIELQMFSSHYGLTLAESQVLRQLCRGLKAAQIARAHGVSDSTVLTQISAIRNKTLFNSVRDLLGTLSKMPQLNPVVAICKSC